MHLLGRADRQVKIGGHRVELGQVEAACAGVEGVRAAAAVATGEGTERRIIAFVVTALDVDDVARAVRRALPAWAAPSRFERLSALPTGPRGKVDLEALCALAGEVRR